MNKNGIDLGLPRPEGGNEGTININYLKHVPQHAVLVARWLQDEWGDDYPDAVFSDWLKGVESRLHDDAIPLTVVALENGIAVGTASIYISDMGGYKELTPWLAAVYVKEGSRRRGIGSILVRRILQVARALGIERLYLFTPDQCGFYERIGWKLMETTRFLDKQVYVMEIGIG